MKWTNTVSAIALLAWATLVTPAASQAPPATPNPAPAAATPPPPPTPVPFDDAVTAAATALFEKARVEAGNSKIEFVIDPLIDGVTGTQSAATQTIEKRIVDLVHAKFPRFEPQPFMSVFLSKTPLVLVGTFTPISHAGQASGPKDAYRVCLTLADLKTHQVVSKGVSRAKIDGVNATPSAFSGDMPVWSKDPATDAYIKLCQGTKLGETIDPAYTNRMLASALISEATNAYDSRRFKEALDLYKSALGTNGGQQLRAYSGIYLSSWKLNKRDEAEHAFGELIGYSFNAKKLGVRLLFRPGSTNFVRDAKLSGPYPMWLKQIAKQTSASSSCIEIVGHTSRTGTEPANDKLSAERAEAIKAKLVALSPDLASRITTKGVGWRENLVGTGRDDASDAPDRRVEFKLAQCS